MGRKLLGLVVTLSACYSPAAPAGAPCAAGDVCPTGLSCVEGLCVDRLPALDAPAVPDAPLDDAPLDDAPLPDAVIDGAQPARWVPGPDLPTGRTVSCAVVLDGFVFSLGGSASSMSQTAVYRAPISGTSLGAWTATTGLPSPTRWHGCAAHPATRSIYVVGGDLGTSGSKTVWRGAVAVDGDIAWSVQNDLPSGRRGASVVVVDDTLFVIGGEEADGFLLRATVYAAAIGPNGRLDLFRTTTSLPDADYVMGAAVSGSHVILTGGFTGATAVRSALAIGANLGPMMPQTSLVERRERHGAGVLGGWLYVTGGESTFGQPNLATTQRARVMGTGEVGAWESQPDLPEPLAYVAVTTSQELLFAVGGSDGTSVSSSVYILVPEQP